MSSLGVHFAIGYISNNGSYLKSLLASRSNNGIVIIFGGSETSRSATVAIFLNHSLNILILAFILFLPREFGCR